MTEIVDLYSNPALIIWDMQYGMATRALNYNEIVGQIRKLIDTSHSLKIPVVYSQLTGLPYEFMNDYIIYWAKKRGMDPKIPRTIEGNRDWQILDELAPSSGDIVLKKHTASFFVGTYLEYLLRIRNVKSLILTGVSTEVGIETTARHASCLGFIPLIAEDAIGSSNKDLHSNSLQVMRGMFELQTTDSIIQKIKNGQEFKT